MMPGSRWSMRRCRRRGRTEMSDANRGRAEIKAMSDPELAHVGLPLGKSEGLDTERRRRRFFGFWLFLMSDAVLFALLFATYGTMVGNTVGGPTPASEFKVLPTFVETLLLLTSSATFGRRASP